MPLGMLMTPLRIPHFVHTDRVPSTTHGRSVTDARIRARVTRLRRRGLPTVALALVLETGIAVALSLAEAGTLGDGHVLLEIDGRAGECTLVLGVDEAAEVL